MPKKPNPIRVIGEGEISFTLLDISIESKGFIGSGAIIVHRPGISDELVYHYLVSNELISKRSAIIFPFSHPLILPITKQPEIIDFSSVNWDAQIQPGSTYRLHSTSDAQGIRNLSKFRKAILPRSVNDFPIIFIVDTLQKLTPTLDRELRILIREAPMNRLSVWLHCPLNAIPSELFSIIGNISVIWPSKNDYDILKEHFSTDHFDLDGDIKKRGMLFASNLIIQNGKGWQFSEMEFDDLKITDPK